MSKEGAEGGKAFNKNYRRRVEIVIMSKDGGRGEKPFNKKLLIQGGGGELIFNDGEEGKCSSTINYDHKEEGGINDVQGWRRRRKSPSKNIREGLRLLQ